MFYSSSVVFVFFVLHVFFFFFKQKTAYEMRISDWSSDVCSSDLPALLPGLAGALHFPGDARLRPDRYVAELARVVRAQGGAIEERCRVVGFEREGDRVRDRKSVV